MPDSEDEHLLWSMVTRDVKPLKKADKTETKTVNKGSKQNKPIEKCKEKQLVKEGRIAGQALAGHSGLDRATNERLRRGAIKLDGRLDLHGKSQQQAYDALQGYIAEARDRGKRCVLIITGKGGLGDNAGVLRQKLPEWLAQQPLSYSILGFHRARPKDGGDGAYYVLLKKKQKLN